MPRAAATGGTFGIVKPAGNLPGSGAVTEVLQQIRAEVMLKTIRRKPAGWKVHAREELLVAGVMTKGEELGFDRETYHPAGPLVARDVEMLKHLFRVVEAGVDHGEDIRIDIFLG